MSWIETINVIIISISNMVSGANWAAAGHMCIETFNMELRMYIQKQKSTRTLLRKLSKYERNWITYL